jgi:acyl-coenzyme A thioesterase PaaI-like protein
MTVGQARQTVDIPPSWHQGRTCYGGLSATLAYQAARNLDAGLPPMQSAQISFSGPLSGQVEIEASMLRRGRNTAFIRSDIFSGGDTGLSCNFIFMNRRESQLNYEGLARPDFPPIPTPEDIRSGPAEFFTGHMQYPDKRLELGLNTPRLASWHRFTERDELDTVAELICIGDGLPPSAMGLMTEKGMVSSMNWQINMLTDTPSTKDGWWFLESYTHYAGHGASSQYMTVWNSEHEPVMTGMQSVAIFV